MTSYEKIFKILPERIRRDTDRRVVRKFVKYS